MHQFAHVDTVAVIGAGVAGLQTARALTQLGKTVTIFDKASTVGGVWRDNYADYSLQVPRELYQFPEYPYPARNSWEKFPAGPQVQEYIEGYANEFDLLKLCRFGTDVRAVAPRVSGGWKVMYANGDAESTQDEFDFCVVATGMYSSHPRVPLVSDAERFTGEILHSSNFADKEQAAGRRVVVVGGGKSAIDIAVAAAKADGSSVTLLFREAHWPVPRLLADLVPFKYGTYSRLGHFMLPTHIDESLLSWWFHSLLTPIKWSFWRAVEQLFRFQFSLKGDLLPSIPIEIDLFNGGQILNYDFRRMLRDEALVARKGTIDRFTQSGIVLGDGTELAADMVVFGTGFTKSYDLFEEQVQHKLPSEHDGLYLYRNVLTPHVRDLAFVGSEVSTFNNILTHALQAQWLRQVLAGEIQLPTASEMQAAIEREQAWKRSWMPSTSARASIWQLHMMKYHDMLCKDMGVPHKRKSNPLAEIFMPYTAEDYEGIFAESHAKELGCVFVRPGVA